MENFKQNKRRNNRGFSDKNSGRPMMHKAICTECGRNCEVPFKPTGDKPILCSDCFGSKRGSDSRRFGPKDSRRFSSGDKRMHKAVCDKCKKECEVPFRPTSNKPIYCNQCFNKGDRDKGSDQSNKQFETINTKLDEILKALTSAKAEKEKKTIKKTKVSKPKKKAKKVVSPKKKK